VLSYHMKNSPHPPVPEAAARIPSIRAQAVGLSGRGGYSGGVDVNMMMFEMEVCSE
jgi:hypothetical protein